LKGSNKLKKVNDFAVILNLLSGARDKNSEIYVWKLISDKKHLSQVRIESIRKARKDFAIVPCDGSERNLMDIIGASKSVDIYVPEYCLLFRTAIRSSDPPFRYYLEIPEFVAQLERRKNLRLVIENPSDLKISFTKKIDNPRPLSQYFHKDCYDVSVGGFSFYISKMETKFFNDNNSIDVVIKIDNVSLKAKAQIITKAEIEPDEFNGLSYKVWRIGCMFTEIDHLVRKSIEKFIFERIKEDQYVINE
jgi:hypothetical protein